MRERMLNTLRVLCGCSDEQAMERVRAREDAAAFAQLHRRWERPVQNLCLRMTGDAQRAEDLAQEVFTRVYARRKAYQVQAKFSTWLWRITLNACYDELRRMRRHEFLPWSDVEDAEGAGVPAWGVDPRPGPDGAADAGERSDLVRRALLELPEHYRAVVVLRHYEDMKFHEIATVLDIPEGTVKSRMAEALARLERALRPSLREAPASAPTKTPLYEPPQSGRMDGLSLSRTGPA